MTLAKMCVLNGTLAAASAATEKGPRWHQHVLAQASSCGQASRQPRSAGTAMRRIHPCSAQTPRVKQQRGLVRKLSLRTSSRMACFDADSSFRAVLGLANPIPWRCTFTAELRAASLSVTRPDPVGGLPRQGLGMHALRRSSADGHQEQPSSKGLHVAWGNGGQDIDALCRYFTSS
mmetsp:Transcript_9457/g.29261  ORF Transcript_9457/g.29261 Transcript_9457/m.29261 type:complete len:176 (+) Transcript_9457:26-553(+)